MKQTEHVRKDFVSILPRDVDKGQILFEHDYQIYKMKPVTHEKSYFIHPSIY